MNQTVKLVNLWGAFEEQHPDASIEDFCRYHLSHAQKSTADTAYPHPPAMEIQGQMLKTIGRIAKLTMMFSASALKGTGLKRLEEAGLVFYIFSLKNPKKSETVYSNLIELSSGTEMLNRLIIRGVIAEHPDKEDRRSKRLSLTAKGEKIAEKCFTQIRKVARMMTLDMPEDDMALCLKLIEGIDQKFSEIALRHRDKGFEEVFRMVMQEAE